MPFPKNNRKDGTLAIEDDVRKLLRVAIKHSGKGRGAIAQEMSEALGRLVTPSMLADFTRNGRKKRQVRFPLAWTPALVKVTGSRELEEFALSLGRREKLAVGEWVAGSRWILEKVKVGVGRSAREGLKKAKRSRKA